MNKPLTVVHIISGLAVGGAEMMLYKLLRATDRKVFNPSVITLTAGGMLAGEIEADGIPVYSLEMQRGIPSFSALKKLRRILQELKPDILQGWMYHGNLAATVARLMGDCRPVLVWNIRQSLYDLGFEKPLTRQVIRLNRLLSSRVDALLYNSQLSRDQHEAFGFATAKTRLIGNGFDLQKFSYGPRKNRGLRARLAIPESAVCVGHVGRYHFMKDHPVFLTAAQKIAKRYPEVCFLLSGNDVDRDNRELLSQVQEALRSRFFFLGEQKDVVAIMQSLDIFVSSSLAEGFPNVLGEAMAVGVPCVATDVGDSALVVGDTGVVVPSRDPDSLADAMEQLIVIGQNKRMELGRRARKHIEKNFSIDAIAGQYADLYTKLVNRTRV